MCYSNKISDLKLIVEEHGAQFLFLETSGLPGLAHPEARSGEAVESSELRPGRTGQEVSGFSTVGSKGF